MIAAAREEAASPLLNLLNDLRDLFSGPATAAETESYLEWRIEQADQFGVSFDKAKEGTPRGGTPRPKPPNSPRTSSGTSQKPHRRSSRIGSIFAGRQSIVTDTSPESQVWFSQSDARTFRKARARSGRCSWRRAARYGARAAPSTRSRT